MKKLFIIWAILCIILVVLYIVTPAAIIQFCPITESISKLPAKIYVNNIKPDAADITDTNLQFANVLVEVVFKDRKYKDLEFEVYIDPKSYEVYCDTIKESVLDYYLHKHLEEYLECNFPEIKNFELVAGGDHSWDESVGYREFYENLGLEDFNKYYKNYTLRIEIDVGNITDENDLNEDIYKSKVENLKEYLEQNGFKLNDIDFRYVNRNRTFLKVDLLEFED